MSAPSETGQRLRFGAFELDVRSRELRKDGVCIRLQEQPFEILRMMLERPGDVVTRDELRQRACGAARYARLLDLPGLS